VAEVLFASEERHLRAAGLRSVERHATEHRRFLDDLAMVNEELGRTGERALSDLQVASWVRSWVDAHVGQTDQDLERLSAR
jgi:hemerythrin